MIAIRKNTVRLLGFAVFGASLTILSNPTVWAAPVTPAAPTDAKQDWAKHRQEWMKERMDALANRLEIKASQQAAWQAYTKVFESMGERPIKKPEVKSDAASIARAHADM